LIRKLVIIGSALALSGSLFVSSSANAADAIDNSNGTVSCDTITKGVIKAKPSLTLAGGAATILSVSGVLSGCTTNVAGVTLPDGKSKFKGTLNAADNGCAGLSGPSASTGSIVIKWSTVPAVTLKTSTVNIVANSTAGGFATVVGGARGVFDVGTGPPASGMATAPVSVTGGFTGGDGGASSGATVATQESIGVILAQCGGIKGVKQLNIAAGALSLA
jgi:hypothetical protein